MDFLRLHLPGLHQALRGALDSLSTFVSYLMGDEVPTVDREAPAAEELREVAAGRPGKTVEEAAQEALEGLRVGQGEGVGEPSRPGEAGRCQKGSSAADQTWGWREGSSLGDHADSQDTGAWEAAKAGGQEPSVPAEAGKKRAAESGAQQDRINQAQERQEPGELEENRREAKRTWERKEEEEEEKEEEVKATTELGLARGAESEWTWHREPERKAGVQKVAEDRGTEQVVKEAVAETEEPRARGDGKKEEEVVVVRVGRSRRAPDTQGPGAEFEHWTTLREEEACTAADREEDSITSSGTEEAWTASGREEARTTSSGTEEASGREEADLPGVREAEYGPVPGERIPEATGRVWILEEASRGEQEEEVNEKREAGAKFFPEQTQGLGTEELGEAAGSQTAGKEAAGQESEEEARKGFEGEASQHGKEAEGRQDLEIRASLEEEEVQTEEAQEEKGQAGKAELAPRKETPGHADVEAAPEVRPEEEFIMEGSAEAQRSQEALGVNWGGPKHKVTEGQDTELRGGAPTSEERLGGQEELGKGLGLRKEATERRLEERPRPEGSAEAEVPEDKGWESQTMDMERTTQEEKAEAESGEEEAVGGQALEAKAQGGWESTLPEHPGCGTQEGEASIAENEELRGDPGAEEGTVKSLGESEARETKESEVESAVLWEAGRTFRGGWRPEEVVLSLQESKGTQDSSLGPEIVADEAVPDAEATATEEEPEWQAGAAWEGEFGREEAGGGAELMEATEGASQGGKEFGLEGSAEEEEEAPGRGGQTEALVAGEGEWAGGDSAMAEGGSGTDGATSGSQAARAEAAVAVTEAEGPLGEHTLLEKEAGGWQAREQREDSEGQCGDHCPEGEAPRPLDVEDATTGGQRPEAEETDPEGFEDIHSPEGRLACRASAEALLEPSETAEAPGSTGGDPPSSWCEALLPGTRLDVSAPRSRALLSRSSSQRRSRPSFRRAPGVQGPQDSPSSPPEEGLSAPEQTPLQLEEAPEPSPPRPEGTPVPARRRPLGQGFGLAHPGMMQELQARLGRPSPSD